MAETNKAVNPVKLDRQTLVELLNRSGQKNGWGQITTTTTIQSMVSLGLPRFVEGRVNYYSIIDLAAFLLYRQKNKLDEKSNSESGLKSKKLDVDLRLAEVKLKRLEDELVSVEEMSAAWEATAVVMRKRLESFARNLGGEEAVKQLAQVIADAEREVEKTLLARQKEKANG